MTTNFKRATEVIFREFGKFAPGFPVGAIAYELTRALDKARLIAPDLPAPVENKDNGNPSWFNGWVEQDWGEVELHHNGYTNEEEETTFTAEDARRLAYALLAAANYAEESAPNE